MSRFPDIERSAFHNAFASEPPAEVEDTSADAGAGLSGLKTACVNSSELRRKSVPARVSTLLAAFASANVSGFARGAFARQLLKFVFRSLLPDTATTRAYAKAVTAAVDMYTINAVVRGLIQVRNDEDSDSLHRHNLLDRILCRKLAATWGLRTGGDSVLFVAGSMFMRSEHVLLSVADVISALLKLSPAVALKHGIVVTHTESFNENNEEHKLAVFTCKSKRCALRTVLTKDEYETSTIQFAFHFASEDECQYNSLIDVLDVVSKENFIATVDPVRNYIELGGDGLSVVPRRVHKSHVYNLDIDTIAKSLDHALSNRKRRVVALIGDPGLGKTESIHAIINRFPNTPAFFMTSAALGRSPEPRTIRSVFRSASITQSILVIDDFDGFDVRSKSPCVTEFLRQFDGSADFKGVALLAINDPQNVAHTILDRPGRVDEVWRINYLDTVEVVAQLIKDRYNIDSSSGGYEAAIERMVEQKFSTSRIVGAVDYAAAALGEVSPTTLMKAVDCMLEFRKNANTVSRRGRLVDAEDDVEEEAKRDAWSDRGSCPPTVEPVGRFG